MYELERYLVNNSTNKEVRDFVYEQYNKTIETLNLTDEPEAYLMFIRLMEEFIAFHKQVDKSNTTNYEIKIIYSKNKSN